MNVLPFGKPLNNERILSRIHRFVLNMRLKCLLVSKSHLKRLRKIRL